MYGVPPQSGAVSESTLSPEDGAFPDAIRARRWLAVALATTLVFRIWLSVVFPFTPDEAYFALWGRYPDLGYHDHPPMVGWWLATTGALSESVWALRVAATFLPAACALLLRAAIRRWRPGEPALADWAAICLLLLPSNVWNVLITTDTPLAFFTLLSILLLADSTQDARMLPRAAGALLAGVFLGLAFTSKYFAVLLGVAFLVWAGMGWRERRWRTLALVIAGAVPFIALNLYWNYQACWCNVMFNLFNRHEKAHWSVLTPGLYALTLAYLLGPLLYFAWRERSRMALRRGSSASAVVLASWAIPLVLFGMLSLYVRIGLHWLFLFLPAVVLWLALEGGVIALVRSARILAGLAVLHVVIAVSAAFLPLKYFSVRGLYPSLVFLTETRTLIETVRLDAPGYELASSAYAPAAVLGYHAGVNVPVFGMGSSHARQDDFSTDWRTYAGKNIVILQRNDPSPDDYEPYFREVEMREISLGGVRFHEVLGREFNYERYRDAVLNQIRRRYYRIPGWLPVGQCIFCERYFPGGACRE